MDRPKLTLHLLPALPASGRVSLPRLLASRHAQPEGAAIRWSWRGASAYSRSCMRRIFVRSGSSGADATRRLPFKNPRKILPASSSKKAASKISSYGHLLLCVHAAIHRRGVQGGRARRDRGLSRQILGHRQHSHCTCPLIFFPSARWLAWRSARRFA